MRISQAARAAGVSRQTVEYYIMIGLVAPIRQGTSKGRFFDADLVRRVLDEAFLLLRDHGVKVQAPEAVDVPPDAVPWGSPKGKQGGKPGGKGTEPITQPQPPPVKETVKPPEPKVDLDALWRDYAVKVISRIQSAKQYPPRAKRQGITGAVTVKFTVSRSGSVSGVAVSGSSGQPVLDAEARDAVTRAAPFPPIPGALNADSKTMSVTLKFEIR